MAVLMDLLGPKFRLGELSDRTRELGLGADVVLAFGADTSDALPVRSPRLLQALQVGESVYLADGAVKLEVKSVDAERVVCRVLVGISASPWHNGRIGSACRLSSPPMTLPACGNCFRLAASRCWSPRSKSARR